LRTPTIGGHVIAVNLVGCLYVAQGRVAENTLILALEIARQKLGPDHRDVADLLNSLGALHGIQLALQEGGGAEPASTRG
jgi:hypothetical protein